MTCQRLDGRLVAQLTRHSLQQQLLQSGKNRRAPKLIAILVGQLSASQTYVQAKQRACREIGIDADVLHLSESITLADLKSHIESCNNDPGIDGILVQLPLPNQLDPLEVASWLNPMKDVDGLHPLNLGKLVAGQLDGFVPCTPKGIMRLLNHYQISTRGKRVTIVGRSLIVGRPLSILMSHPAWSGQATVTLAHSQSPDLSATCRGADILICAVGRANFLGKESIAKDATIIDVGINRLDSGQLCGDIDSSNLENHAKWLTPVPGGVGPMTVAMLMENTLIAWARHFGLSTDLIQPL